jgi:hypothetical protein
MSKEKKMFEKVCEYLGCDLDSEPCQELQEHLHKCPQCEVFIDEIKNTVKLYKKADECEETPKSVSKKLFATLDLDNPDEDKQEED